LLARRRILRDNFCIWRLEANDRNRNDNGPLDSRVSSSYAGLGARGLGESCHWNGTNPGWETLCEAEYSFEYLRMKIEQLREFPDWQTAISNIGTEEGWNVVKRRLFERTRLDGDSTNTVSELENAARIFVAAGVDHAIIVTSPTHLVRATRDALSLFQLHPVFNRYQSHFMAVPSATDFRYSTPHDVLILEPPHRPDRFGVNCRDYVERLLKLRSLDPGSYAVLLDDLDRILRLYELRFEAQTLESVKGSSRRK